MPVFQISDRFVNKDTTSPERTGELIQGEDRFLAWQKEEKEPDKPVVETRREPQLPPCELNPAREATNLTADLWGSVEKPGKWVNVGRLIQSMLQYHLDGGRINIEQAKELAAFLKDRLTALEEGLKKKGLTVRDATDDEASLVEKDLGMNGGPDYLFGMVGFDCHYYNTFIKRYAEPTLCPGLTGEELEKSTLWLTYTRVLVAVYQEILPQVFEMEGVPGARVRR